MIKKHFPDFLGIGAQRSGTTWLYKNLNNHPQIWTPPIKEIHFFDALGEFSLTQRYYKRHLRKRVYNYVFKNREKLSAVNIWWDINYFTGKRDFNWYSSLFQPSSNQIAGEITPSYSTLDKSIVEKIHTLNPNLKIIFLMRDPIERDWSSAIKGLARDKKRDARQISNEKFLKKVNSKGVSKRGNYIQTLGIWEEIFPPSQIHIDFYDEIQENPEDVLLRIFDFLNISVDEKYIPSNVHDKVNSTDGYKIKIPPIIEKHIARSNIEQLKILNQRFGGHTTKWLERTITILEQDNNHDSRE